jgi:hypothetical protein
MYLIYKNKKARAGAPGFFIQPFSKSVIPAFQFPIVRIAFNKAPVNGRCALAILVPLYGPCIPRNFTS